MKIKRPGPILVLTFLQLLMSMAGASGQNKYALIVAAGTYKAWPKISSMNDVPYIRTALEKQGFPSGNITELLNEQVTMAGIRKAFKDLIAKAGKDDVVVIHFSTHGEQIADDNGDETDGLDESIVTWDAPFPVNRDHFENDQAYYFRDDEFGKYMLQLRAKLGNKGDLLVILDACHSASGTRGDRIVRGGQPPLVPKDFQPPAMANNSSGTDVFMDQRVSEMPLSSFIIISAAKAAELNSEMTDSAGVSMGSLTFAMSQALTAIKPGTTYRSLFADVLSSMNQIVPEQHPVYEGNGENRGLFGGNFVAQQPFAQITEIDGKNCTLDQGMMAGIIVGSGVSLYPKGTTDPANATAITTGTVKRTGPFQSYVTWDKDPGLATTADGWVFVMKPVYKIPPVVLTYVPKGTAAAFSTEEQAQIRKELAGLSQIRTTGVPELRLQKGVEADSLLITANGFLFDTLQVSKEGALTSILKRYTQYKFLQQLNLTDPQASLQVSLVPFVNDKPAPELINQYMRNGLPAFKPGDQVVIRVKNTSSELLYLNILDLQPDGRINPIFPNTRIARHIEKGDLGIEPGAEKTFGQYPVTIGPPFGLETFKIFVSPAEIDMETIVYDPEANKTRGDLRGLADLFADSFNAATRGGESGAKVPGSAFNLLFRIVPK